MNSLELEMSGTDFAYASRYPRSLLHSHDTPRNRLDLHKPHWKEVKILLSRARLDFSPQTIHKAQGSLQEPRGIHVRSLPIDS